MITTVLPEGERALVSYRQSDNSLRSALVLRDRAYDLAKLLGDERYARISEVLEDWSPIIERLTGLTAELPAEAGMLVSSLTLGPPVPHPNAIFCAAANYRDHMMAMAKKLGQAPEPSPHEMNVKPYHFLKPVRQTLGGPDSRVAMPSFATSVDWEVELVAVIGREAKNVAIADALAYVAGYTIGNDLSVRDRAFMKRPNVPDSSLFKTDFLGMKGFDGSCPIGPYLLITDSRFDPQTLGIRLWLDDELMQDSNTREMVFSVAEQIAYLSERTTLFPGDLVLTGTPAGTGAEQDRFLRAGQVLRAEIEGLGSLQTFMT